MTQVLPSQIMRLLNFLLVLATAILSIAPQAGAAESCGISVSPKNTQSFKISRNHALTFGAGIRTEAPERDLFGVRNGGSANSINTDNGNLNFSKGDFFALQARGASTLKFEQDDFKFVLGVDYLYDHIARSTNADRSSIPRRAKQVAGADLDLRDFYIAEKFVGSDQVVSFRAGNMVLGAQGKKDHNCQAIVGWSRSTFFRSAGLDIINPIDFNKLRRPPGVDNEGAALQVPMIHGRFDKADAFNVAYFDNNELTLEAFYQLGWEHAEIEADGTFFSTNDFSSPGAERVYLGFGQPFGPKDFAFCTWHWHDRRWAICSTKLGSQCA